MRQIRSMNFVNMISASPLENRLNLLSMVNVKYLVARSDLDWEGLRPVDFTSKEYPELKVYENTRRLPRAFWVPHCIVATTHRDFGRIMVNREFDPARLVVLERSPKDRPCQKPPGDDQGTGKVRLLNRGYDHLELESDAAAPGFLFLSESYYPGWRATVDGAPATIHRANYKFRALVLPAGRHRIQMEYRPVSFRLGAMVSGFTILICAGFLIKRWH
ncbi:MAG: YfhO family protein [Nitrospinaceae bacterium]|nr:YfhO family protein [Nitrospinaceae bacterium]NIU95855.1 YfhO family protein [Nitrospinaceae bacterium]NIW05325.1 YfhO family protein [Nitrospinaceae bacterium]NIW58501.1 YfhO family protein [Nitrospinaceae bacterium]NIX33857.1 YfhO family protein [Nitrospinaceae bacterium]